VNLPCKRLKWRTQTLAIAAAFFWLKPPESTLSISRSRSTSMLDMAKTPLLIASSLPEGCENAYFQRITPTETAKPDISTLEKPDITTLGLHEPPATL